MFASERACYLTNVNPTKVLLADDHPLVRSGIRSLLDRMSEIQVVAEAGDGHEALRLIEEHQPDIVLMDISMPNLSGLETTVRVTKDFPNVHVIILSMHSNDEYVSRAFAAGAAGYLVKTCSASQLEQAIAIVASGNTYLGLPDIVADAAERKTAEKSLLERLTPRQSEVLRLLAEGGSVKSIAQSLNISAKTVEIHRAELMNRLDLHDIASLVRFAVKVGLISLED
jgi:DNA-binding NarL/FixJ family response regulator